MVNRNTLGLHPTFAKSHHLPTQFEARDPFRKITQHNDNDNGLCCKSTSALELYIILFDGWLLDDWSLQFGIKMPINASCDSTIMQATKLQKKC